MAPCVLPLPCLRAASPPLCFPLSPPSHPGCQEVMGTKCLWVKLFAVSAASPLSGEISGGALMRKARYQGNAPTFRDQEPQSQVERPQSMTCGAPVPIGRQPDGNQWGMCNGQGRERSPAGCPDPSRDRSWLRAILSQLRLPQSRIQKRTKSEPHNLIISLPLPWLSPGSWLSSSKTPSRWDKNRRGILDLISPVLGASAFV